MRLFRSIKFNVLLFLVIAGLSALGTFLPQVTTDSDRVLEFINHNPISGKIIAQLGFFDIYHMLLFAGLLGLMAFDVVVCKLANHPPDKGLIPLPKEGTEEQEATLNAIRLKPQRLSGPRPESVPDLATQFQTHLHSHQYRIRELHDSEGATVLLASRHRLQRWGTYLSHISLVVILFGAMLKSLFGFETMLPLLEGRSGKIVEKLMESTKIDPPQATNALEYHVKRLLQIPERLKAAMQRTSLEPLKNWELHIDKFTVDFYPNSTTPSTFASDVRVTNGAQELAQRTIRVNAPLDIHSVRFYQATWGVTGMIDEAHLNVGGKVLELGMKDSFKVPSHPWRAQVEQYLPDFAIGEDGQPTSQSLEWKNPALILGFYTRENQRIGGLAIAAPSPVTPKEAKPWALFFLEEGHFKIRPPFEVVDVKPYMFSGIQVTYDPGFWFIVGGVMTMLIGLCMSFYLHQRRIHIFIRQSSGGTGSLVDIGGWGSRGEKGFGPEFKRLFAGWSFS